MDSDTRRVLDVFAQLSAIPRRSKHERAIGDWLLAWAAARSIPAERDATGNVLVRVEATAGCEHAPTLILQGHMDMVCEKSAASTHDFDRDPIVPVEDGEWLRADGTTLGADNGIAIAIALALVDADVDHPPLEILITVDEETGLTGAQNLEPGWLTGSLLLNLDSEDEGVFTVGCAGGRTTLLRVPVDREPVPAGFDPVTLSVSGLSGGHSGVDVHRGRANANVIVARILDALVGHTDGTAIRVAAIDGGSAHNAIPRDARATLYVNADGRAALAATVDEFARVFAAEYGATDPALAAAAAGGDASAVSVTEGATPAIDVSGAGGAVLTTKSAATVVALLMSIPDGVVRMSRDVDGLVETSTNLATIRTTDTIEVGTSQRSSYASRLAEVASRIEAAARLAGASVDVQSSYPAWEPAIDSAILSRCRDVYRSEFDAEPVVEVIHAGLECGVIGSKYPGMEMISFGPTIRDAHSPAEALHIPSLSRTWRFTTALVRAIARQGG